MTGDKALHCGLSVMPIRMAYDHFITKVTPPPPAIALTAGIVGAGLFLPRGSEGLGLPAPTAFHAFTFYWDTSGAAVTSDPRAYFMRSKREQKQDSGCGGDGGYTAQQQYKYNTSL